MKTKTPILQQKTLVPFRNYDPIGAFFREKLHLSPLAFGILIFVADVLVDGWLGWKFNVFTTQSGSPGILQDYTALTVDFIQNPIICSIYLWSTYGTTKLLQGLLNASVFQKESDFYDVVEKYRALFKNRLVFYIILMVSILFPVSQQSGYMGWLPWKVAGGYIDINPMMGFARVPFWFIVTYATLFGMFNVIVTIFMLRKMFQEKNINIAPLHPDKCGGLGSISQFVAIVAYVIGARGLVISAEVMFELNNETLLHAIPVIFGIVAYIIFAPVFFFWPLGTAHEAMEKAKERELLEIANQHDILYKKVKKETLSNLGDYEASMKNLEQIKKLYEIADNFPIWPFDVQSLRRFFVVVTSPLLPALITISAEVIKVIIIKP